MYLIYYVYYNNSPAIKSLSQMLVARGAGGGTSLSCSVTSQAVIGCHSAAVCGAGPLKALRVCSHSASELNPDSLRWFLVEDITPNTANMVEKFVGTWKMISSENFDDYMKAIGRTSVESFQLLIVN